MSRLRRVTSDPAVCHGQPTVRGLRYPVENLLELLSWVVDAAGVRDLERVLVEGYPLADVAPLPGALFDERVLAAAGPHLEVGYLDGHAVTVGVRHIAHGLVVLVLGATLPEARHRGCWAAHGALPAGGRSRGSPPPRCSATTAARARNDSSASCRSPGSRCGSGSGREQARYHCRSCQATACSGW